MTKVIQRRGFFTSTQDEGYLLQGKERFTADYSEDYPVFTFHKRNQSGQAEKTYYVKGSWYVQEGEDHSLHHISELSELFGGIEVRSISFTAVTYKTGYGLVEMVGVNGDLYVTNVNHAFEKKGGLSDFVQSDILFIDLSGALLSPQHTAYDVSHSAYQATITLDGNNRPSITIGQKKQISAFLAAVVPTGFQVHAEGNGTNANAVCTYVNSSYGLYKETRNNKGESLQKSSGKVQVTEPYRADLRIGTAMRYELTEDPRSHRKVGLLKQKDEYQDTVLHQKSYNYNEKQQIKKISDQFYGLNESAKSFNVLQTVEQEITYLWEDNQEASASAKEQAIGLISQKSEKLVQGTEGDQPLSRYLYKNTFRYAQKQLNGWKGIFFEQMRGIDGKNGETSTSQERYLLMDASGLPTIIEGIVPDGYSECPGTKVIYARGKKNLPIATFSGITVGLEPKMSAHYLGFEPYEEEYTVTDKKMSSKYFSASGIQMVDQSFLGSKAMRFIEKNGRLNLNYEFPLKENSRYLFSCWRKTAANSKWQYYEKVIEGKDLKLENIGEKLPVRKLMDVPKGTDMTHIMLKEINCTSTVSIYDPVTLQKKAELGNNGVPTIFLCDEMNRPQISYKMRISLNRKESAEYYYDVEDAIALEPYDAVGFSRFGGRSLLGPEQTVKKNTFNTALHFTFPELGKLIPAQGGNYNVGGKKHLFLAGSPCVGGQQVRFQRAGDTIDLIFGEKQVWIYRNDTQLASSEPYLHEQGWWIIGFLDNLCLVVINGRIEIATILEGDSAINSLKTSYGTVIGNKASLLFAPKFDLEVRYFDYLMHEVQAQRVRNIGKDTLKVVTNQNFYDRRGNLVVETLRAVAPSGSAHLSNADKPLMFREGFASIIWGKNGRSKATGELYEYYKNGNGREYLQSQEDADWPFVEHSYEIQSSNRLMRRYHQGSKGEKQAGTYGYHGKDTFQYLSSQYKPGGRVDDMSRMLGDPNGVYIAHHTMFDVLLNRRSHQAVSRPSAGGELSQYHFASQAGLTSTKLKQDALTASECTYLLPEDAGKSYMSKQIMASGRIHYSAAQDSGARILFYDSMGHARLAQLNGEPGCPYTRYDLLGRPLESGVVTLKTGNIYDYFDRVNRPDFPNSSDGTVQVLYTYTYDGDTDETKASSHGKLVKVWNAQSKVTINYQYDFLGRVFVYNQIFQESNASILSVYDLNCQGNPLYETHVLTGPSKPETVPVVYEYDMFGFAQNIKILGASTVFSEAQYDLYDRLIYYRDAYADASRKYDLFGNETFIGIPNGVHLKKVYEDSLAPNRVTKLQTFDNATVQKGTVSLEYHPFKRLAKFIKTDTGAEDNVSSFNYNQFGSIVSYTENEQGYSLDYEGNRLSAVVRSSDKKQIFSAEYNQHGAMNKYVADKTISLTYDPFYRNKLSTIQEAAKNSNYQIYYDFHGHKLSMLSGQDPYNQNTQYFYGHAGKLTATLEGSGKEAHYYIYCNGQLICELDLKNKKSLCLMYDKAGTLRHLCQWNGSPYAKEVSYENAWGKVNWKNYNDPFKPRFLFAGMEHLEMCDAYNCEGALYLPEYGVISAPSLALQFFTPYRPLQAEPIR